jgi:prolyl oligopeptidase
MSRVLLTLLTPLVAGAGPRNGVAADAVAPPPTPIEAVTDTLHGTLVVDPYRWLENGADPKVQAWTEAQNAYTRHVLDAWPGRAALTARYDKLFAIDTAVGATVAGLRLFLEKKAGLAGQPVLEMREGKWDAPGRVVIDPNTFSADGTVALDWKFPSPDGRLIAYGKSEGGSEQSTLFVRDVTTGIDLPDRIPNTQYASLAWDPDGKGFLYARHPAKGDVPAGEEVFHIRIFHHVLGEDWSKDTAVWDGAGAPIQEVRQVYDSSDHAWTFLATSLDWAKNDLYARPAGSNDAFHALAKGLDGSVSADAYHGTLYLLTNVDSPRYRIVRAAPAATGSAQWSDVVPEQSGVIQSFQIVGGRLVLHVVENATSRVLVYTIGGKLEREITLPTLGTVSGLAGDPGRNDLFFRFASYTYPSMVYHCDVVTGALTAVEQRALPFDPAAYETAQVWVTSKDGTKVPMFLTHKKGITLDGARPTILYGYGGFNVSETPEFKSALFPWFDAGGVFAHAVLRGGGEFGRAWHEAGRLGKKQNVYDDFYACAEFLIADKITNPARLACNGGSNGGLLVGVAITQRPELWGAAVCEVPLLDMLRYQNFSIARYWVPEYGSAEDPVQFNYLLAYSPYHNVKPGTVYPPTLFTAGASDARVDALHARKMTALLQAQAAPGSGPILLRVESRAGHGQGKPTRKRIESAVDVYGFLMSRFAM